MSEPSLALRPTLWVFFFLLMLPVSIFFSGLLFWLLVTRPPGSTVDLLAVVAGLSLFLWSTICSYLYIARRPCRAMVHDDGDIEVRPLIGSGVHLHVRDLVGYSACRTPALWTRLPEDGVVLYLRSGIVIEFSDATMKSLSRFINYLMVRDIPYLGEERSWFPIKKRRYKFVS